MIEFRPRCAILAYRTVGSQVMRDIRGWRSLTS